MTENDDRKAGRSERSRRALKQALDIAGMTPTMAARGAGFKTPNTIYNFLKGRSDSLSQNTLERLSEVIPGASLASLTGLEPFDAVVPAHSYVSVRAAITAGLWQPAFDLPYQQQYQVPMPVTKDQQAAGVFGVEVREPGAEKKFRAGSILLCLPIHAYEDHLLNGDWVILQRIVAGKVELTVRELELQANEAWLWLRSTHHEHQVPIRMPFIPGQLPRPWSDENSKLSIAAIVVGAYIPLVRHRASTR
nr:hypothetical protein [uncultured Rhodopila sp.]